MSDRSGTVGNCWSITIFSASPDVERWAVPTVAVSSFGVGTILKYSLFFYNKFYYALKGSERYDAGHG